MPPWEKYQSQAGPWAKYASAQPQGIPADATPSFAVPAQAPKPPGIRERFMRGFTDASRGLAQLQINAGYNPPYQVAPFSKSSEQAAGDFNQITPESLAAFTNKTEAQDEQAYQSARGPNAGWDVARGFGSIAGSAPLMAMPGGAASTGGAMLQGGATGALSGAMQPVTDDKQGYWGQKGIQTGVGTAAGGIFSGLLNLASKAVSPKVNPDVKYLQDRDVGMTPGFVRGGVAEDKAKSLPIMGPKVAEQQRRAVESMNLGAYNEALKPIGQKASGKVGFDGIKEVGDKLSNAYEELIPNLRLVPDEQFSAALDDAMAQKPLMSDVAQKQLDAILERQMPNGPLEGEAIKRVQTTLGNQISKFSRSQDPSDQMIAEALGKIDDAIKDNMARVNPQYAERLKAIDTGWAVLTRLERAAGASGRRDGVFTGEQLMAAVRAGEDSVRKRGFARGTALMQDFAGAASRVMGNRYPDSGTAGRVLPTLMGAAGAYGAMTNPGLTAAGLGGLSAGRLAYSNTGNDALVRLLTQRPEIAPQVAAGIRQGSVPASAALSAFLVGNQ